MSKDKPIPKESQETNESVVETDLELLVTDLLASPSTYASLLTQHALPYCPLQYPAENTELSVRDMPEEMQKVLSSFPDLQFHYDSIEEVQPGVVVVSHFHATGTHTGTPYAFGPFPNVPARGTVLHDPPTTIFVYFCVESSSSSGDVGMIKIERIVFDCNGKTNGLPLYYTQVGGLII